MSEPDDRLIAAELQSGLKDCRIGKEIAIVEETESTNDLAWVAAERGASAGLRGFRRASDERSGAIWPPLGIRARIWVCGFPSCFDRAMTLAESPRLTSLLAEIVAAAIAERDRLHGHDQAA